MTRNAPTVDGWTIAGVDPSKKKQIKPGHITEKTETRSGLWTPGPMNYKDQGSSA